MDYYRRENLCHDPIHGYIPFVSNHGLREGETSERQLIDHPWLQRMRHIHQLQTAWWVFPSAEHTRFQHVVGAMHLGSRLARHLYPSLQNVDRTVPSPIYVEALLRLAGLLHDVGHGPFGHFFDAQFLRHYELTHEVLGSLIIRDELGPLIRGIRRTPHGELGPHETLDPEQVAWLIVRPRPGQDSERPLWLTHLRALLSGIYTIDNMDFVLRDAYMSGFSQRSFDLERLVHYSFFSERGLTIFDRGMEALVRFMQVRADLFRSIYFHRTVRAIDLMLEDLFRESREFLFPGDPREHLDEYLHFTESSLLVDVGRWYRSSQPRLRDLGQQWQRLLRRDVGWQMACQRTQIIAERDAEQTSIFSDRTYVERRISDLLPADLRSVPIRVDIARHLHRPNTLGPASGQNYLFDSGRERIRPLNAHELYERLPVAHRICRVYTLDGSAIPAIASAFEQLAGVQVEDDLTNM
ncbi:MAG: HD domain-containing protein [Planctomycetales bacterium]|nr:HD domain-containing protein [Planctomycetales bacterium]